MCDGVETASLGGWENNRIAGALGSWYEWWALRNSSRAVLREETIDSSFAAVACVLLKTRKLPVSH